MRNFCFVFLISIPIFGQTQYPKDYFTSPLDIPIQLSGNFGELRFNHIHAGFDIKTQKKEGLKVYAAGDGYISRIKISEVGYGKAIYITHPNGYTSVYGHLQSGYGEIEKFIKKLQYKAKSYEIDVTLSPSELVVNRGDIIAISGNTGGSDGPHLHFESRINGVQQDPLILARLNDNRPVSKAAKAGFNQISATMRQQLTAATSIQQASAE